MTRVKKPKDLYSQIYQIMGKYYYDVYNKRQYYQNVGRAIVKLVASQYVKKIEEETKGGD